MVILGIETSCDETALSLVEASGSLTPWPKFKVLKNLVSSQIDVHREFGGVVPNLAKREHLKNLPLLLEKLKAKRLKLEAVDLFAVTVGPGLEPALWTGINFAVELGKKHKKLVLGVNHLEGHLYSFLLPKKGRGLNVEAWRSKIFPAVQLLVSGGHTMLGLMKDLKSWKVLGETRDDAVGEAFDKVARMLELPYPGGPEIQKLAQKGNSGAIDFPRPMLHEKNFDFSFSGLKTSVLYYLRDHKQVNKADVAASFQKAAVDVLTKKTMRAAEDFSAKSVILSGGVAANKELRDELNKSARMRNLEFLVAEQTYNTDNAAMIAAAGYINSLRKKKYPLKANGGLGI